MSELMSLIVSVTVCLTIMLIAFLDLKKRRDLIEKDRKKQDEDWERDSLGRIFIDEKYNQSFNLCRGRNSHFTILKGYELFLDNYLLADIDGPLRDYITEKSDELKALGEVKRQKEEALASKLEKCNLFIKI